MRPRMLRFALIAAALAAAASGVCAPIVTVTPENMADLGWSIEVNSGPRTPVTAYGGLTTWGPCVYEHHGFVTEEGMPMGRGAFFAECGYGGMTTSDKTPDTVWLGLDKFNGQPLSNITLNQIKTMSYYSFVSRTPTLSDSTDWSSYTWWRGPNSPIMLQITAVSPDGGDYKQFWIRPRSWGYGVQGPDGGMDDFRNGKWQYLDCISDRWYHAPERQDLSDDWKWESWAELCATFGNYHIMATSMLPWGEGGLKSPGWDGQTVPKGYFYTTGTGKGLNFEVGARKFKAWLYQQGAWVNWYRESIGFRGHVDYFTLGIDLDNDGIYPEPGEVVTYDFEPSPNEPEPAVVASSIKALDRNPLVGTLADNPPYATNFARTRFLHKVVGKVTWRTGNPIGAALEDGSKIRQFYKGEPPEPYFESIRYYFPLDYGLPSGTWLNSWWRGWGLVERLRGFNYTSRPPLMLWTDPDHLEKLF
jgi:hypothetical protein